MAFKYVCYGKRQGHCKAQGNIIGKRREEAASITPTRRFISVFSHKALRRERALPTDRPPYISGSFCKKGDPQAAFFAIIYGLKALAFGLAGCETADP